MSRRDALLPRFTISLAILLTASSAPAQTKIQAIAQEIEADAKRENPRLGIDTLIRASERLRSVDPATARHLLDVGAPWLDSFPAPSYFTYRFMISYARMDLDAAEKARAAMGDKLSAYGALIEQSARVKDYARVNRLVRSLAKDGFYASGSITFALHNMVRDAPQDAATLLNERVADFPETHAQASDVHALLNALAAFPWPETELTRAALRKVFAAIDRPNFKDNSTAYYEETATYQIHGKEIKTATTFETVLLPAAAYLAVFDSEAFRTRVTLLPNWGPSLADLTPGDLPQLARSNKTLVQKSHAQQTKPAPLPDISKMSFQEALAAAHSREFPASYFILTRVATRSDFTAEQRKAAFEEIFSLSRQADPPMRYPNARWALWKAADSRIDGLFAEAALEWLGAFDAAVSSNDRLLLSNQENGMRHNELLQLDELFQQHDFALQQPHPSIVSRRALARLDRAANELADFSLPSVNGTTFRLRDMKGKIVLIDFWATWCPPCRDALPAIEKTHRDWNSKGVVVLGVDDEPAATIRSFISKNGITYPTLLDPDRKVHELFGVDGNGQGIPLTVVFDREGKFVGRVSLSAYRREFSQTAERSRSVALCTPSQSKRF
jgi:peroxiredoxin